MKKRPPLVLYSSIVGVLLAMVIYHLATDTKEPRLSRNSLDRLRPAEGRENSSKDERGPDLARELKPNQEPELAMPNLEIPEPDMVDPSEILAMPPESVADASRPVISRGSVRQLPARARSREAQGDSKELAKSGGSKPPPPTEKEDEPAIVARKFLTLLIAQRAKALGKKPVRYIAPWVTTEYSEGRQSAIVFYSGEGVAPDCDVHLRFDARRKKWNVTHVQGGGFGSFTP